MPRWLPALLALSVLTILGFAARPVLPVTNPHLTQANLDRVVPGMRREQAEAILGPAGDYRTRGNNCTFRYDPSYRGPDLMWMSDEGLFWVTVDAAGRVVWASFNPIPSPPVGLWEGIRWRWRRWRDFQEVTSRPPQPPHLAAPVECWKGMRFEGLAPEAHQDLLLSDN
jgi:hypothetical protein